MVLLKSYQFWVLVAGILAFVAKTYFPTFPLDEAQLLALIVFILAAFNIKPELQARGLL
jgi:hypothetical protein